MFNFLKPPPNPYPDWLQAKPFTPESNVYDVFWQNCAALDPRRVMEAGTLQSYPGRTTHMAGLFPNVEPQNYVKVDIQAGPDVDVTADLHAMPQEWAGQYDCFIGNAVWEHLERPWVASKEVFRILKPGGIFLVSTHQCFPIHGYPSDFFRFSKHALRLLFEDAGFVVDACDYRNRCLIIPPKDIVPEPHLEQWNEQFPSFVHVEVTGRKPA